ncbi:MAG: DUF294 nucleotidyltransferase-like domain-containing protein [Ardenticatenaceae bacterium]|nr:DUF294 nucleotidyltransferase-like domain-containing protein [Ardenticatenaceae bacterium]
MSELYDILHFVRQQHPFDLLPEEALSAAIRQLEIEYVRRGRAILQIGEPNHNLYLIRTGAVDLFTADGRFVDRMGEGELFGYPSLLTGENAVFSVQTIEDTLVYLLPEAQFNALRRQHQRFDQYFILAHTQRVRGASIKETQQQDEELVLSVPLETLLTRPPLTMEANRSVVEAARFMSEHHVSSLVILDSQKRIAGIFTDRDMRTRVVAAGRPVDTQLAEVMTPNPITINRQTFAFEALMAMSQHNIHHLPVTGQNGDLAGVITTTDLIRLQSTTAVYLIGDLQKAASVDQLERISKGLPRLVQRLVAADARAADIGRLITLVHDTLTRRLLSLAEHLLGSPPHPYAWIGLGSQGRQEQNAASDQDNALVLSEGLTNKDAAYFQQLAAFVCDGLNRCGFTYCPGQVMATNLEWRQPLSTWRSYFARWFDEPEPQALLNATIFFDLRHVAGDQSLTDMLLNDIAQKAPGNQRFLAQLARNALTFQPPLGFFRRFVLEKGGDYNNTLDLKHRGVVPIVDLARIFALEAGLTASSTHKRLSEAGETMALAAADAGSLRDAFEYISFMRLHHQDQQLRTRQPVDNYLDPQQLSTFERENLRRAFATAAAMQQAISRRYLTGLLG